MRLSAFLVAAFSLTGACSPASAFADPPTVVTKPGPRAAITFSQRLAWFGGQSFGPLNLAADVPGPALFTLLNKPHEAGPHWKGFAERYGVAVSTNALSNGLEAGLGAIWGEDPRYLRDGSDAPLKSRLGHVVKWTVAAPNRNGELRPAYARFIGISAGSYISNAWREPSDTDTDQALERIAFGLLGRMGNNAFAEFWPDAKRKLFHRGK